MGKIGGEQLGEGLKPWAFVMEGETLRSCREGTQKPSRHREIDPDKSPVTWLQITPLLLFYLLWSAGGLISLCKIFKLHRPFSSTTAVTYTTVPHRDSPHLQLSQGKGRGKNKQTKNLPSQDSTDRMKSMNFQSSSSFPGIKRMNYCVF